LSHGVAQRPDAAVVFGISFSLGQQISSVFIEAGHEPVSHLIDRIRIDRCRLISRVDLAPAVA
jgi:hypothetical protein